MTTIPTSDPVFASHVTPNGTPSASTASSRSKKALFGPRASQARAPPRRSPHRRPQSTAVPPGELPAQARRRRRRRCGLVRPSTPDTALGPPHHEGPRASPPDRPSSAGGRGGLRTRRETLFVALPPAGPTKPSVPVAMGFCFLNHRGGSRARHARDAPRHRPCRHRRLRPSTTATARRTSFVARRQRLLRVDPPEPLVSGNGRGRRARRRQTSSTCRLPSGTTGADYPRRVRTPAVDARPRRVRARVRHPLCRLRRPRGRPARRHAPHRGRFFVWIPRRMMELADRTAEDALSPASRAATISRHSADPPPTTSPHSPGV